MGGCWRAAEGGVGWLSCVCVCMRGEGGASHGGHGFDICFMY